MRIINGAIRTPRQMTQEELKRRAELDANYVCRWIVQADQMKTHEIPQNIVDLAKRATR